jgi:hypothetical protein
MEQSDVFALKNSGLDAFLFAEVGDELNGSGLTVLSVLARLGHDPWTEAARLVNLPRAAAIDCLSRSIARMPLSQEALAGARATATRLVGLLPVNNNVTGLSADGMSQGLTGLANLSGLPKWLPMTLLYCALALGMGASMITAPRPDVAVPAANTLAGQHPPDTKAP